MLKLLFIAPAIAIAVIACLGAANFANGDPIWPLFKRKQ